MRLKLSIILLFSLVISACGWHLRGITPLPAEFRVLYLDSKANHSFNQQLRLLLEFNQVLLTSTAEDAQAVLHIDALAIEKRTLALTSDGKIAEFEINATLNVSLKRYGSDYEIPIEIHGRRHLRNDVNNSTATANAERSLMSDLEKDLVTKLMRRLQRISANED